MLTEKGTHLNKQPSTHGSQCFLAIIKLKRQTIWRKSRRRSTDLRLLSLRIRLIKGLIYSEEKWSRRSLIKGKLIYLCLRNAVEQLEKMANSILNIQTMWTEEQFSLFLSFSPFSIEYITQMLIFFSPLNFACLLFVYIPLLPSGVRFRFCLFCSHGENLLRARYVFLKKLNCCLFVFIFDK